MRHVPAVSELLRSDRAALRQDVILAPAYHEFSIGRHRLPPVLRDVQVAVKPREDTRRELLAAELADVRV